MQVFERLAMVAEFRRQPIEQLRMRGQSSSVPEIVGRIDQTAVEMITPDAVDDGAPGQRVARIGDPVSEGQAAAAFVFRVSQLEFMTRRRDGGECTRRGELARTLDVATAED